MPVSVHLCYAIIIVNYANNKRTEKSLKLFYSVSNFLILGKEKKPARIIPQASYFS